MPHIHANDVGLFYEERGAGFGTVEVLGVHNDFFRLYRLNP